MPNRNNSVKVPLRPSFPKTPRTAALSFQSCYIIQLQFCYQSTTGQRKVKQLVKYYFLKKTRQPQWVKKVEMVFFYIAPWREAFKTLSSSKAGKALLVSWHQHQTFVAAPMPC